MFRIGAILSAGLVVCLLCAAPSAVADQALIALDNNAWAGNANLGVYPPSSGAIIDYELYVRIEDTEFDGYESQGLSLLAVDILTDTGIQQPMISFSPTTEDYQYTIVNETWTSGKAPAAVGGFGMGFLFDSGNQVGDDLFGPGATMPLIWDADTSPAPGNTPASLAGIGIGTPGVGTFDSGGNPFPAFGTPRSEWYLLRGQTFVPEDPGDYAVEINLVSLTVIRSSADLNQDVESGFTRHFPNEDVMMRGFDFTVTPEPASAAMLLLAGGVLLRRRSRPQDHQPRRQKSSRAMVFALTFAALTAWSLPQRLHADVVTFGLDNNAWAGNANLGVYPPSSGAIIDYELYVQIEDVENDGYDSQGIGDFALDILSNTNIEQPYPTPSPTTIEYLYTIMDVTWTGGPSPVALGGFGYTQYDHGVNYNVLGNINEIAAVVPSTWSPDSSPAPGVTPRALAGIGIGTPGVGTFDTGGNPFPFYGTARGEWYLLRGQTLVPDEPGHYNVNVDMRIFGIIALDEDLNHDAPGYLDPARPGNTLAEVGYSFVVSPEPATLSLLLLSAAIVSRRRRV